MAEAAANPSHYVNITCCRCCVTFGMPRSMYEDRKEDGQWFWCPAGHQQHFTESEVAKLRREKEAAEKARDNVTKRLEWKEQEVVRERERRESVERHARSVRGHVTRLRKRLAEGKCPCCEQEFPDMAAHIAEKHPRYKPRTEPET